MAQQANTTEMTSSLIIVTATITPMNMITNVTIFTDQRNNNVNHRFDVGDLDNQCEVRHM